MSKAVKDQLFDLVKSLSKSEKRQFKLYVGRLGGNENAKFLSLFNLLDRMNEYREDEILQKEGIHKRQLTNIKAHLYRQILVSLRLNPAHRNIRIQLREQLDFATILYHKGLYPQSLRVLDRAKALAMKHEEKNLAFEIIELEKVIEAQYITRSTRNRAEELTTESAVLAELNQLASELSNLALQLYGEFLKSGYAKDEQEYARLTEFFNSRLPDHDVLKMGFREKLWLYKAYLWYSFLVQDFLSCYRYALKWVQLFDEHPGMTNLNPVFFLRGHQYLLESLFFIQDRKRFPKALGRFREVVTGTDFPRDDNISSLIFLYSYTHQLNLHFLEGRFTDGLSLVDQVLEGIDRYRSTIDEHHVMTFYYKIACMYFGAGMYRESIDYLERIITNRALGMREDLLCYARILNLVAHYEAGLDYHLDSLIRQTYKFLIRMQDLYEVQREMMNFLRGLGDIYPHEIKREFVKLHAKLKTFEDHPYERRSFLYLDIISWLESNIQGRPIEEVIQEKIRSEQQIGSPGFGK